MYFKKGKEMLRMNSCLSLRAVIILQHRLHVSGYQEPPSTVTDTTEVQFYCSWEGFSTLAM